MVAVTDRTQHLPMQTAEIASNTTAIRSSIGTDRFDIEFGLQMVPPTTHFRGAQCALVDTSHEKFRQLYLDTLSDLVNPAEIDYIIISHTEPDHSGLVKTFSSSLLKPQL